MVKMPKYVYIVKAAPFDADGANDQVVKVFANKKKIENYSRSF